MRTHWLVLPALLTAFTAFAEEASSPPEARWSIGLGLAMGLDVQDAEAASNPGLATDDPGAVDPFAQIAAVGTCQREENPAGSGDFYPPYIRCPVSGATLLTAPSVGASLEIMTPRLARGGGQPRLFIHAGADYLFSARIKPAQEGGLDTFSEPDLPTFSESSISGQGSESFMEWGGLQVTAGAGIAFSVDTPWRKIRIKPSVEYIRQTVDGWGSVHRAITTCGPPACQNPALSKLRSLDDADLVDLSSPTGSLVQHGVGPGIELDTDAGRLGPFVVSLFAGASAYYFPGKRDFQAEATQQFSYPGAVPPREDWDATGDFDFELDRWAYRIRAGLRFRWQPE